MDEDIIKKKKKNYYHYHHNQNKNYYHKRKKKNLIMDNSEEKENILLFNEQEESPREIVQVIKENIPDYEEEDIVPVKKTRVKTGFFGKHFFKIGLGFAVLVVALLGGTYAFFNYTREDTRQADIAAGEVYVRIPENTANISLNKIYPRTSLEARSRSDNYIDFTVNAKNTSEFKELKYSIDITNGEEVQNKVRINPQYLIVDLEEKVNNSYTYVKEAVPLSSFSFSDIVPVNTTSEITKEYRLRVWVSDAIIISDTETNRTYTQAEFANLYANLHITVNSNDQIPELSGTQKLLAAIAAKQDAGTCTPTWTDTNDDVVYLSGTNDCVDMNYVWYSGKLWRILAIYPDETMKLVTEDNITTIIWNNNTEYDGSWVYQWLNEDFYSTLYNKENIVLSNITWNYSTDDSSIPVRPETIETQKTKVAPVGLITAYEYYNSYRNTNIANAYLNRSSYWWTITPASDGKINSIGAYGDLIKSLANERAYGVRPSIIIKSGLRFTGDGTKNSPYQIEKDKDAAINNRTLLSSRSIGEYVKFDNDLYRIMNTDNNRTKLIRVDYIRDANNNNEIVTKYFASSVIYGKLGNTASNSYWDYYLNNDWYNSVSSTYQDMLVDDIYYLGRYPNNSSYKATICKDASLDTVTTSNCTKYTSQDADKTFTGKVGLPRAGEMFASQFGKDFITLGNAWTISRYSDMSTRYVGTYGGMGAEPATSSLYGARPTITLKAGIIITNGTGYVGGTTNSPFEISE